MFGYYTPILILQAFCIYHAFKNHNGTRWFFIIIFLPLIGSIIYLYLNFSKKINVEGITEEVKNVVNSNYNIEKLEKASKIAGTFTNKINLSEEYIRKERYNDALELLISCQTGIYKDDSELLIKLTKAYYLNKDYKNTILSAQQVTNVIEFKGSEEMIAYAWALYFEGNIENAEEVFESMDVIYSNYLHRLEYAKFLAKIERLKDAKEKLEELLEEISHMDNKERKMKRVIHNEIKKSYQGLKQSH